MRGKATVDHSSKRMPYRDVPGFLRALRKDGDVSATKDALEWLILTVTRTNETLGARFSEVNAKTATWTVPAERTNNGKDEVVPLSARALEILAARKKRRGAKSDLIFEVDAREPLSSAAMLMQMRRLNTTAIPHGFRYSFAAWAKDRASGQREAARASLDARRALLDAWSAFCVSEKNRRGLGAGGTGARFI